MIARYFLAGQSVLFPIAPQKMHTKFLSNFNWLTTLYSTKNSQSSFKHLWLSLQFLYLTLVKFFRLVLLSHFYGLASRHFFKGFNLFCAFKTNTQSPFTFCGIVSTNLRRMYAQYDSLKTLCEEFLNWPPSILLISSSLSSSWWLSRSSLLSSATTSRSQCNRQIIIIIIIWLNYPPKNYLSLKLFSYSLLSVCSTLKNTLFFLVVTNSNLSCISLFKNWLKVSLLKSFISTWYRFLSITIKVSVQRMRGEYQKYIDILKLLWCLLQIKNEQSRLSWTFAKYWQWVSNQKEILIKQDSKWKSLFIKIHIISNWGSISGSI